MIQISDAAQAEIKRMQESQDKRLSCLRLDVKLGGCSGLYYTFAWETEIQSSDRVYPQTDFSVIINEKSLPYLNQLTLDFTEDLMGGGFRFQNPQATQSCSCGISFTLE